jgi:hypothetical protein
MEKYCYDPTILYFTTNFTSIFMQNKTIFELYFWSNVFYVISNELNTIASLYVLMERLQEDRETSDEIT